jgi:hypothetical protein
MLSLVLPMACLTSTEAHRSGCQRWHSCASDHGTYTYGDGIVNLLPSSAQCDILQS